MDKQTILEIADSCLTERLARLPQTTPSSTVRELSLLTQQILYDIYHEPRANGGVGDAEDILRNDNIKAALAELPAASRQLASDVLVCAHARLKASAG